MEPSRHRKLESLAKRIEPGLWQYELILMALMAVSLIVYYTLSAWAGAGALLLGAGLILAIIYFFRWFLPRSEGSGPGALVLKLHSAAMAFGVLGGVFRVLYMQSDILFLSISLALAALVMLLVLYYGVIKKEPIIIGKPDVVRMVLCMILAMVLLLWQPPLPFIDSAVFPAEEMIH